MAKLLEYKCPACGGLMTFDSVSQKMKCQSCGTEMDITEFDEEVTSEEETHGASAENQEGQEDSDNVLWENVTASEWAKEDKEKIRTYLCKSCGGEIITDDTTGATNCPYCGSQVVMQEQFSGKLMPDLVIPFQKEKMAAIEAYRGHLDRMSFVPQAFAQSKHIDEIKGIYVPFWLLDAEVDMDAEYHARKVRTYLEGDYEVRETKHYEVRRAGTLHFKNIPMDCSAKMDDTLMEAIEPYDNKGLKPFKTAYLSGYYADRYDVQKEETMQRAQQRIERSACETLNSSLAGYDTYTAQGKKIEITDARYRYALYPVWLLNTQFNGKTYTFAMNGQTGKLVGDLPEDKGAFWRYVLTRALVIGVGLFIVMMIFRLFM